MMKAFFLFAALSLKGSMAVKKAEVTSRNAKGNCWTIIDNTVYDLSNLVHGNDDYVAVCGKDGEYYSYSGVCCC